MSESVVKFEDGHMIATRTEAVGDHLDACKDLRSETNSTHKFGNSMLHRLASIPATVVLEWRDKYGCDLFNPGPDTTRKAHALLNGPYKYLKTVDAHL